MHALCKNEMWYVQTLLLPLKLNMILKHQNINETYTYVQCECGLLTLSYFYIES